MHLCEHAALYCGRRCMPRPGGTAIVELGSGCARCSGRRSQAPAARLAALWVLSAGRGACSGRPRLRPAGPGRQPGHAAMAGGGGAVQRVRPETRCTALGLPAGTADNLRACRQPLASCAAPLRAPSLCCPAGRPSKGGRGLCVANAHSEPFLSIFWVLVALASQPFGFKHTDLHQHMVSCLT